MKVIVKTCPHHGEMTADDIKVWKYKNKTYRRCKKCIHDKNARYEKKMLSNPEFMAKKKQRDKKRWDDKKNEISAKRKTPESLALRREWYQKNREKQCAQARGKQAKYRADLADTYMRKIIQNGDKSLKFENIPQSLVDFKRTLIRVKKLLKAKTQEKNYQKSLKGG